MPRQRNPLSKKNRTATFTGAEVARVVAQEVEREVAKLAASKRARPVRDGREFNVGDLSSLVRAPITPSAAFSWTVEQIVYARDAQMAGRFKQPARLAESFGTDDALFTARGVRLAPVQSLRVELTEGRGPKADKIKDEAEALFGDKGVAISSETMTTIRKHLVDHGVAFAAVSWTVRPDGSRVDPIVNAWPIEYVEWHATLGCYVTQVRRLASDPEPVYGQPAPVTTGGNPLEAIVHGNGRWIVFSKSEVLPHRDDAALLPAALVWARHAFAMRDWTKGSAAHGNPKVVGEMPVDTALTDEDGALTEEAAAFLTLIQAVASQDNPVGIKPAGTKIDYMTNDSKAWEVWVKLTEVAERAAARIYLGTDGVLGAQGGAPGVDISALFGVATSKIQSDLACIERGLQSGLISPWCAINFGDDKQAPTRRYVFPDPDESRVREDHGKRLSAFLAALKAAKDVSMVITPELLAGWADAYGVKTGVLAVAPPPADTATSTPTTEPANDVAAARTA